MIINPYKRHLKNQLTKLQLDYKDLIMLYLQKYNFKMQFIPGKHVIVADALSK